MRIYRRRGILRRLVPFRIYRRPRKDAREMKTMKLSEAIRLGSMLSDQGYDCLMGGRTRCALASASDASGIPAYVSGIDGLLSVQHTKLADRFPILRMNLPEGGRVMDRIWSMNDTLRLTREEIADWVETIERAPTETGGNQGATEVSASTVASASARVNFVFSGAGEGGEGTERSGDANQTSAGWKDLASDGPGGCVALRCSS